MGNSVSLSVKTDEETKKLIKTAADSIGLSLNSFILMASKQMAKQKEIVISNPSATINFIYPDPETGHIVLPASMDNAEDAVYDKYRGFFDK
jgi:hypothetical protein